MQIALLRAAPVSRRPHLALSLSASVIGAARQALARSSPEASARELDLRFIEPHHGRELAAALRQYLERPDSPPE
ncbi:MAG: hypothetical protein ACRD26_17095 [Vicinamibacterales bacterium]